MSSAYHIDLAKDAVPAQGASFSAQGSKTLSSQAKEFILVVQPTGSNVKVKLEQSANGSDWVQVQDAQDVNIEATITNGSTGIVYVDVPLLQYVRVQLGEATTSATCNVKLNHTLDK
tara:strand:+ start:770 stop:1120 length:351 start_codon:yes stop_codon:yes gene_type:complete